MKQIVLTTLLAAAVAVITPSQLSAQTTYGGALLDHDIMMPYDFASLSQTQAFGTARSMAMGGAFTSLGGDLSSVSINPAGLGMFMHEVFSITPMVSVASASTTGVPSWVGNSKSSFGLSNVGATFNIAEKGRGALISLTGAISYNRLADYNSKMSFSSFDQYNPSAGLTPTIIDIYGMQLGGAAIYPESDGTMEYANDPYFWPAQGAYDTYLLDPKGADQGWTTNTIGYNASVAGSYSLEQSGRTDEYTFAMGGNIANIIYFGATIGLQEINQTSEYTYQEEYFYDTADNTAYGSAEDEAADEPLTTQALYSFLQQDVRLSGGGMNLKVGLTARPTRALRIGAAFHSPTYYSLTRTYQSYVETELSPNYDGKDIPSGLKWSESPEFIDSYEYSWRFRTPSKLLLGASYQIGSFGVISFDYERQWYNWIRVSNAPGSFTTYDYQTMTEDLYRPTNTLRAGLEVKPIPTVALRAGYGCSSSMIKDEAAHYMAATSTDSNYITCGVGVQFTPVMSLDVAYQYHHQNYTPYRLFYAEDQAGTILSSALYSSSLDRNFISATLTFRL